MGMFDFLGGKSAQKLEASGDRFVEQQKFGDAKLEFERALSKLSKDESRNEMDINRVKDKLQDTRENLSKMHQENANNLLASELEEDALELFELALELTENPQQKDELKKQIDAISSNRFESKRRQVVDDLAINESFDSDFDPELDRESVEPEMNFEDIDWKENFEALYHALPQEEQDIYDAYNDTFKKGIVALNIGEFETAKELLERSLEENQDSDYINIELATVYLNLGQNDIAQEMIDEFLKLYPLSVKAYELMCDILWEKKEYSKALSILESSPKDLKETMQMVLLFGETLMGLEQYQAVDRLYQGYIDANEWQEPIARSHARMYELSGRLDDARNLYEKLINSCATCHGDVDPYIKQRYADTCFETNRISPKILELYFDLTVDDPQNRSAYYQKISLIYEQEGNRQMAEKYKILSQES